MLLMASCVFYMFFIPAYILILFITILIDYFAGIWIERSTGKKKKIYLIISIISTCLVLFVFKYFNFFIGNFNEISQLIHWNYSLKTMAIILPIGLSFHTFQSLSYVIEVYRGNQKAEKHFGIYSLYVMFYPQLVAGPIERPQNLLHQFYEKHDFDYNRVANGLKLMAWGLFKKVVIADRLSVFVNQVYTDPYDYAGLSLVVATLFFSFQIYCDFSGYSDIAIGSAQVMGFKLMNNFNRPYFSKSISEFWKRWHISLSTWFKDYLYISMGGNRVSVPRWYFNLFITFLVSGLWHGANWTYIVWGALHGSYLVFAIVTQDYRTKFNKVFGLVKGSKILKYIQILTTFVLVTFAWIFFRSNTIEQAIYIATHLHTNLINDILALLKDSELRSRELYLGQGMWVFLIAILSILFMEYIHLIQRHSRIRAMLSTKPKWLRWSLYYLIVLSIIFFGVFNKSQFIYFQF
jgi:D-alanyl-lipoteichoic acid acyltransferase DltB (MBOAT superfamily)